MKAQVSWDKDLTFTGTTDSGYKTVMDGSGNAVSPMESVLLANNTDSIGDTAFPLPSMTVLYPLSVVPVKVRSLSHETCAFIILPTYYLLLTIG